MIFYKYRQKYRQFSSVSYRSGALPFLPGKEKVHAKGEVRYREAGRKGPWEA